MAVIQYCKRDTGPGLFISKLFQEDIHYLGIKMLSALFTDVFQGIRFSPSLAIRTVAGQRIPNIDNRKYPGCQRDLFTFQASRITGAIPPFMVAVGNIERRGVDRRRKIAYRKPTVDGFS